MILAFASMTHFAVMDTGAFVVLSPWLPLVILTDEFIAAADGRRVVVRGDELTFRCVNGAATYALGPMRDDGTRAGQMLCAWGP